MRIMYLHHMPASPQAKERLAEYQESFKQYVAPSTQVEVHYIDDYPGSKLSADLFIRNDIPGVHHLLQTPSIVKKIAWAEQDGFDAVVQSNTFDPGVEAARQAVRIPVVGVTRTSLGVASTLTDAIALVVPLEAHVAYAWKIVHAYHMDELVKDIVPVGLYGEDAAQRTDEIIARTLEAMRDVVRRTRASCLIPLGGAVFPSLVSPEDLGREMGVTVLNTRAIGLRFAELCVNLGLTHASITRPARPLPLEDFDAYTYGP
jgi:Asp/Glu/hydantoin racemase